MKIIYIFLSLLGVSVISLMGLRLLDWRADRSEWSRLLSMQPANPARYDPNIVASLPEPASRFFNYVISPGTPLLPVVEIDMGGQFSLGTKDAPDYQTMKAKQILASPEGFVWKLTLPGKMSVSGSDSGNWTRFRVFGLIPVARMGGNSDHARSAFGRYIAESVFWSPAAVLPGKGVVWEEVDANTARVTVTHGELSQAVDIKVNSVGQPIQVFFLRWSNANPDKEYRIQPFGGLLSDFHEVNGYRLPFRVDAGNMFDTDDYFAFYKAEVQAIRFPVVNRYPE